MTKVAACRVNRLSIDIDGSVDGPDLANQIELPAAEPLRFMRR
jgi:hypothetical protein